jgi:gliding motility-associated-like protein
MKNIRLILFLFVVALNVKVIAQPTVTGSADCVTAPTICGNTNLTFVSSSGAGSFVDYSTSTTISNPQNSPAGIVPPGGAGCHLAGELNPNMVIFTCQSAGTLEFDIASGAGVQLGCYDWVMWPYTAATCSGISGNTLPPTRCCWNSSCSGGTGIAAVANIPAGATPQNYCSPVNVQCGDKFILCISNYSSVNGTVPLKFIGTAVISCAAVGTPLAINNATICAGGTTTLIVTGGTGTATFTPGPMVTNTAVVSPLATTIYTVNKSGGCGTGTVTATVTVLSPTASANNTSPACEGTSFTLNGSGSAGSTYSWTGPAGYNSATQNPVLNNVLPSATGTYTLQTTVTSGTLSCNATATTNAAVIPVNPVSVAPSVVSVCEGTSFGLSANATSASAYNWTGPPSFNSPLQSPTLINAMPNMTGIYTVTASFINGPVVCQSTNTVDVTVKPLLYFGFNPVGNVCGNGTISVPGPAGATSYTWTGPGGYTSNTQNLNVPNAQTNMSGLYTLTVDANGCLTTSNISITVLTPISFSALSSNKTICQGDTTSLYNQVVGGSGTYNISWSPGAGLSTTSGNSAVASPIATTQYTISASDINCPAQAINTLVTVGVNPLPVPNVSASKTNGCIPLCVDLQSNSSTTPASVGWNFSGNLSASGDPLNFCFTKAGTYSIRTTITDINGCTSINMANFQITAYPRPEPSFYWNPSEISVIENTGSFYSSSPTGSISSYFWDFGDMLNNPGNNNAITQNATHEFSGAGTYPVTILMTNIWGCTDTLIRAVEVIEDFTMYIPNAFTPNNDGINDIFQPKGMGWMPDKYEFLIYDRWGTLVFKTNDYTKGWDGTVKGGALCPTDVYVYKIKATSSAHSERKEFAGHVTLMK